MTMLIRPAEDRDIPEITALLLLDAHMRESLDPALWSVASDAETRIETALGTIDNPLTGPIRHLWMVAERDGGVIAVAHGANLPPPPIIDLGDGTAGILFDDSHLGDDEGIAAALIAETEALLKARGAVLFVAASPTAWTTRTGLIERAGYEPTTLYMAKTGLSTDGETRFARPATPGDLDGIVHLSALHRARLQIANPVFWNIHAEADARFRQWMSISLDLPDRAMFVSGPSHAVSGFIIAQPGSPLHLPPAHDVGKIGLIDDFYAAAFETAVQPVDEPDIVALVDAAEKHFRARGIDTAMAICPVKMTPKATFLEQRGYRTANLWMVKPGAQ